MPLQKWAYFSHSVFTPTFLSPRSALFLIHHR
jgi:hypothetical protein